MKRRQDGDPPTPYRPDIDGLRATAILLVVIFHFQIFSGGKAGFMGVDVFFVISGFLITSIILRQLDARTFDLRTFYVHRIRRLSPALTVVLLLVLAVGLLTLFPDGLLELCNEIVVSQLYVANIYFWRNINYFGLTAQSVTLLHLWSLAVEEQFYLFYPLTLLCLHRYAKNHLWTMIGLGAAASFLINVLFVAGRPEATFYLLPTRAWELLVGALVLFVASRWNRPKLADEILGMSGVALIFVAVATYSQEHRFPGYFALLPVSGSALLILSGVNGTALTSRVLSFQPLTYIGKISYPLYLVHWPVRIFATQWIRWEDSFSWKLALLAVSAAIAAGLYHLVENPVRLRRIFTLNNRLVWAYASGVAASVCFLILVHQTRGLPQRFPDDVIRLASYVNDRSAPLFECEFAGQLPAIDRDTCRLGAAAIKPRWLVFGDSHAWAAHDAFDKWLRLKGESGYFIFRNNCTPLLGVNVFHDKGICLKSNRAVADFLLWRADISNVVVASGWQQAREGILSTSPEVLLTKAESLRLFHDSFHATLSLLKENQKHVYLWAPVPGAKDVVPLALARAALHHRVADIAFTNEQYVTTNGFFLSATTEFRHLIDVTISSAQELCGSGKCAVTVGGGKPAYFNSTHVTRSTADFWVDILRGAEMRAASQVRN